MHDNKISARLRAQTGKGPAHRSRAKGFIPAVLYGSEAGNLALELDLKELEKVVASSGMSAVSKVDVNGKQYTAIIRELQRHPVRGNITHCDLFQVSEKNKLQTTVPIHLVGEAAGVKEGGILQHNLREVEIECKVSEVPEALTADISALEVGQNLRVEDLSTTTGVKIITDPETVVATITAPRLTEEAEEQAQAEAEAGADAEEKETPHQE